ncbi:hypothetical protein [Ectobacillus sp. sgz5001026]|uniref:hypothetical protein n=1 Tax=Ectobacillus sp. sgz5001026 TaxID=3242473 RepID=UPI0036D24FB3
MLQEKRGLAVLLTKITKRFDYYWASDPRAVRKIGFKEVCKEDVRQQAYILLKY